MTTGQWIDFLMGFILLITVVSTGFRRLHLMVRCLILQSTALSLVLALKAYAAGEPHLLIPAFLTFLIKGVAIPYVMFRVIVQLKIKRELETYVSVPLSMLCGGILVYIAFFATRVMAGELGVFGQHLPVAITSILIGIFMMVTRTTAISQMIGFLIIENGIFIAEMSTTGMDLLIEVGILFELLIGAIIMGIMLFNINKNFNTINTSKLTTLKE